jgi:hypothetical protein
MLLVLLENSTLKFLASMVELVPVQIERALVHTETSVLEVVQKKLERELVHTEMSVLEVVHKIVLQAVQNFAELVVHTHLPEQKVVHTKFESEKV